MERKPKRYSRRVTDKHSGVRIIDGECVISVTLGRDEKGRPEMVVEGCYEAAEPIERGEDSEK